MRLDPEERVFADVVHSAFNRPRFEPTPRRHDGASSACGHVGHRFAIKDGISLRDLMVRSAVKTSPLLMRLKQGGRNGR